MAHYGFVRAGGWHTTDLSVRVRPLLVLLCVDRSKAGHYQRRSGGGRCGLVGKGTRRSGADHTLLITATVQDHLQLRRAGRWLRTLLGGPAVKEGNIALGFPIFPGTPGI